MREASATSGFQRSIKLSELPLLPTPISFRPLNLPSSSSRRLSLSSELKRFEFCYSISFCFFFVWFLFGSRESVGKEKGRVRNMKLKALLIYFLFFLVYVKENEKFNLDHMKIVVEELN